MKKIILLGLISWVISLICFILFWISPSWVDEQGILHENFGFLPLAYLFFIIGIVFGLVGIVKQIVNKK